MTYIRDLYIPSNIHIVMLSYILSWLYDNTQSFDVGCSASSFTPFWINLEQHLRTTLKTPWWRHQMETFLRYCPFVRGIHRSQLNSPHKGQWGGALMFSLIYAWINVWVNNREAGDLRRHRAHYDVILMLTNCVLHSNIFWRYTNKQLHEVWSSLILDWMIQFSSFNSLIKNIQ